VIGGLGLLQGVAALGFVDRFGCAAVGCLSLFSLPAITRQSRADTSEINISTRVFLVTAWAVIVAGSLVLLLLDPFVRMCAGELLRATLTRCAEMLRIAARSMT
jgi:hypothetical protein